MNSVFILYNVIDGGDGECLVSVHKSLDDAKQAGDKYLLKDGDRIVSIEEWEIDNPNMLGYWNKVKYTRLPDQSYDWRKA